MDQLATDYAGKPVVFLEDDVDAPIGDARYPRWWAAFAGGTPTLPLVMVDSGNEISNGYLDFITVYGGMVDRSLLRLPQAGLTVNRTRVGDTFQFEVRVLNYSGVTLSMSANDATVHAIVYEDAHVGVTDRIVRTAVSTAINTPLASGAAADFTLTTGDLSGVVWANLHSVVLVDYRPGGTSGAFDTLQAELQP